MATEKRESHAVPIEEALRRLDVIPDYDAGSGPEPCVHTFAQAAFGLLGAHWSVEDIEALMRERGVEESGPAARATNHGLVVLREGLGPLFIATKAEAPDA